MQIAQKLYEGVNIGSETTGLITYMRTDGVQMSMEAMEQLREAISATYGDKFVPEKPRFINLKPPMPRKPMKLSAQPVPHGRQKICAAFWIMTSSAYMT